jgi:hypothetical protein
MSQTLIKVKTDTAVKLRQQAGDTPLASYLTELANSQPATVDSLRADMDAVKADIQEIKNRFDEVLYMLADKMDDFEKRFGLVGQAIGTLNEGLCSFEGTLRESVTLQAEDNEQLHVVNDGLMLLLSDALRRHAKENNLSDEELAGMKQWVAENREESDNILRSVKDEQ